MPRFHFDFVIGSHQTRDMEGDELPSRDAVPERAMNILVDLVPRNLGGERKPLAIHVRDETGRVIFKGAITSEAGWVD